MTAGVKLTQEESERLIKEYCSKNKYTFNNFLYHNSKTKITFKCENKEHSEWTTTFSKIAYKGTRCPECHGRNSLNEKVARQKILERCNSKQYKCEEFIFIGAHTPLRVSCTIHGAWDTTYNKFVNKKSGCISCGGRKQLSQNEAENKVSNVCHVRGYEYKPFVYKNNNSRIKLKCINPSHPEWDISYDTLVNAKTGCKYCKKEEMANSFKLKDDEVLRRLNLVCDNKNYTYKSFVYENSSTKITMKCSIHDHPEWETTLGKLYGEQQGCPTCSGSGYNKSVPGYFYIHKILNGTTTYYKYGITGNYKKRFKSYNKNVYTTEPFMAFFSTDGKLIQYIESCVKKQVGRGVLDKHVYKNGFTETVPSSSLPTILEIIGDYELEEVDVSTLL